MGFSGDIPPILDEAIDAGTFAEEDTEAQSLARQHALVKYSEDFGFAAAGQLMAYARRQMLIHGSDAVGSFPKRS